MKTIREQEIEALFIAQKVTPEYFTQVVGVFQHRVYGLVRRMVLIHADADDVTQDVFIRIWEKKHQFQGQSALYTWIYRIATNTTLEFLRKKKRSTTQRLDHNEYIQQLKADAYFCGDDAELKFQEALLQLPDKQRYVFQMKYFDAMKYEAISEILGTSVGALKASYHHATQKLKHALQEEN